MSADTHAQRRRATVLVLQPLLDEPALVEALWLQHETMRGDTVADIIAFIDKLSAQHLFEAPIVRALYSALYKAMRESASLLPADPWPRMQAARAVVSPPVPVRVMSPAPVAAPAAMPVTNPVERALQASRVEMVAVPAPVPVPAPAPVIPDSAPSAVLFGAMVRAVITEVQSFHSEALDEVRRDVLRRADTAAAAPSLRLAFRSAWLRPLDSDWRLIGSPGDLADLLRVLHVSLVDAFGRNGAEQILSRSRRAAEAMPEAISFAPRRLLETIPGLRL
ncbi:MAG: hypothetical protein QG612_636 [Pseudomonadota bacterium]|nr:hypothetical protein [Pseudomonadota bacterium]